MDGSNKHWRQRLFETSQEKGVLKKMINGNVSSELILLTSLLLASVVYELAKNVCPSVCLSGVNDLRLA